jgi:uncharacterized alpha-E superfamily protein
MLSRVANSVYWMARYVERAENVARFIDVNFNLTLGEEQALADQWAPLVYTTGDQQLFHELYGDPSRESVLQFLAYDLRNPNSIHSCIAAARENARTIRETITGAMWEQINTFYLFVTNGAKHGGVLGEPNEFCNAVKRASHTLLGLTESTMSHGEPWHFARMGRLMERADKTSRIVDVQYFLLLPRADDVGTQLDVVRWSALLRSTSALEMYRRVHGRIQPNAVAKFLLLDRDFPRSILFCLLRVEDSLHRVTGSPEGAFSCRTEQRLGRLRTDLSYTTIDEIIRTGMHEFIDSCQSRLNDIGEAIHDDFFSIAAKERVADESRVKHQSQRQTLP